MRDTTADHRRGFTLVELLIVTVLGALVLGAMYQVL
ncbi:MAG: type II secretion system protein J, partial [Longimicrobiales bacterium]